MCICIVTAQSGTRGGAFGPINQLQSGPGDTLSLSLSTKDWRVHLFYWVETQAILQHCLAKGARPHGFLTAVLYHIWATLHWIKFLTSPHPNWGLLLVLNWHKWPRVHTVIYFQDHCFSLLPPQDTWYHSQLIKAVVGQPGFEVGGISSITWQRMTCNYRKSRFGGQLFRHPAIHMI